MNNITPLEYLRIAMNNPQADFRDGQDQAIDLLLENKKLLVIQATGWGKSMVYFVSTKIRRLRGNGPTLLLSPLLALMRNQEDAARRLGLTAAAINSANKEDWPVIYEQIKQNQLDVLLVSPERLANNEFRKNIQGLLHDNIGMLVIDEAHCISDWGHEFRPEYRRIRELLPLLPKDLPVLATTATANRRVLDDIQEQVGKDLITIRGSLERKSLKLQNIFIPGRSGRLAWLVNLLPKLPGSGLVYVLTAAECEMVAAWLRENNIAARAYHAQISPDRDPYCKEQLEEMLQKNELKCLVCTVALGMGFDKPDLGFVVHYQRPASVVHYYQQVGRAGRGIDQAFGIMASGLEDDEIATFFIDNSLPPPEALYALLNIFENIADAVPLKEVAELSGFAEDRAENYLKILSAMPGSPTEQISPKLWRGTATLLGFQPDKSYFRHLMDIRRREQEEMNRYLHEKGCLMAFMQKALGDSGGGRCGRCYNCQPAEFPQAAIDKDLLAAAAIFRRKWRQQKTSNIISREKAQEWQTR